MQLTPDEMAELHRAARNAWEYIGEDIFQGDLTAEISRDDVIELVLDADRLVMFDTTLSPRVREYIKTTDYATLQKDLLPAFPYLTYGY